MKIKSKKILKLIQDQESWRDHYESKLKMYNGDSEDDKMNKLTFDTKKNMTVKFINELKSLIQVSKKWDFEIKLSELSQ